ncbi:hypothetical protein R1flu_011868 [Riccia fluitans]|uniref:histidine kinase n=1 Tax=Riccia fluitans TaxID=41844 RepID=A0ABD1Z9C9_9MARC
MEGRGGGPSCCPGVSGFLIGPSIATDGGRLLHNSFSYPDTRDESRKDTEILLRNNSDVAVHIPSDQDVPESVDGKDSSHEEEGMSKSGCCCSSGTGLAYVGRAAQRLLHRIVCDRMFTTRVTIMIMLAILVTGMTVLAWYFSTSRAEESVSKVVDALRNELLSRTDGTIGYLSQDNNVSTAALARILSSPLISSNFSSFTTFTDQVAPILFSAFSVIRRKSLVSFFGKNGLFVSYSSEFNDTSMVFANSSYLGPGGNSIAITPSQPWGSKDNLTSSRPWYHWFRQSADSSTGLPIGPVTSVSPLAYWDIDLFNSTWNNRHGRASWGIVAPQSNDLLFLSLAPVKRSSDVDSVGVAAVGFSLSEIGEFFKTLNLQGGDIYITTEDGRLLVQTNAAIDYDVDDTGSPLLPLASNSSNAVVAGAAKYLSSVFSSQGTQTFQANSVRIDGTPYILSSAPVQIAESTLVCVILIPRNSLWGGSDKQSHTIFALLLILAICVGVVGCLFIILLTKGISNEKRLREALFQQEEATKQAEIKSNLKSIVFARILNSILDMSKIEAGKLQLEEAEFDLLDVLEEAVEMFAVVGMKKGLDVVLDFLLDAIINRENSSHAHRACCPVRLAKAPVSAWASGLGAGNSRIEGGGVSWNALYGWFHSGDADEREKSAHMGGRSWNLLVETLWKYKTVNLRLMILVKEFPSARAVFENKIDSLSPYNHGWHRAWPWYYSRSLVRWIWEVETSTFNIIDKDEPDDEPGGGYGFKFNLFFQRPSQSTLGHSHSFSPAHFSLKPHDPLSMASRYGISSPGGPFHKEHIDSRKHPTPGSLQSPSIYSPRFPEGVHVLLAVQGQAGRKMTKAWMERRGLHVWTVSHPEDFFDTLERIKFEVFYEESFNWSDCFEISPGNQAYESWADDNLIQPPGGELSELSVTPSSTCAKNYGDRVGPRLLLVIDAAMVSHFFSQLCASLSNSLSNADIAAASRVVWLVTPITPSSVLQTLKQGTVPCDLMLHKPLNVSRLRIVWEQVQTPCAEQQRFRYP